MNLLHDAFAAVARSNTAAAAAAATPVESNGPPCPYKPLAVLLPAAGCIAATLITLISFDSPPQPSLLSAASSASSVAPLERSSPRRAAGAALSGDVDALLTAARLGDVWPEATAAGDGAARRLAALLQGTAIAASPISYLSK